MCLCGDKFESSHERMAHMAVCVKKEGRVEVDDYYGEAVEAIDITMKYIHTLRNELEISFKTLARQREQIQLTRDNLKRIQTHIGCHDTDLQEGKPPI